MARHLLVHRLDQGDGEKAGDGFCQTTGYPLDLTHSVGRNVRLAQQFAYFNSVVSRVL